jgi:hypothetical protein
VDGHVVGHIDVIVGGKEGIDDQEGDEHQEPDPEDLAV